MMGKLANLHDVLPYIFEPFSQQLIILIALVFFLVPILFVINIIFYYKQRSPVIYNSFF